MAKRIAYVFPWPSLGGGEIATLRLAAGIAERPQFEVLAFCMADSAVAAEIGRTGFETVGYEPFEYSYRHPAPFLAGTVRIARALRSRQIDLVHCSDLMGAYHTAVAARLAAVPVVCHVRSNFPDTISRRHTVPLMAVDRFAFVSHATWRNFDRIYRVRAPRGSVVYDWAPDGQYREKADPGDVRRQLGITDEGPLIGMVARVAPEKDFETLFAAMRVVIGKHPTARLVVVGAYGSSSTPLSYWQQLCTRIEMLQLTRHVVWAGYHPHPPELMRALDVLVLATHSEGLPLVLLEAMAQHCPTVATRVGGIPELITDGETGLLHEHGDSEGLADGICRLLADRSFAQVIAARAHIMARSRFTAARTIQAISALYEGLWNTRDATVLDGVPAA